MPTCPDCQSNRVRKSHKRGWLEHLNYILAAKQPYRCTHCKARFLYINPNGRASRSSKTMQQRQIREIALIILLAVMCSVIALYITNKDSAPATSPSEGSP
jgi:DNA-directed RNA polymerase subunit RPC12/RpoP